MSNIINRHGIELDLSIEGHVGCPSCISKGKDRSRNNFMCYGLDENGDHKGGYCYACGYTIPSVEWLRENGEEMEEYREEDFVGSEFNEEIHKRLKEQSNVDSKNYRGIRTDISKPFGVRYCYDAETGEVNETLYPTTKGYQCVGYKRRIHPKDFTKPIGEVGKECEMFGQFKFKTFSHTVLVCGGEHDTLAAFQALSDAQKNKSFNPVAVVSSTVGETAAYRQIQAQYEFFNQFSKIVICMDNDKAGEEAAEKIIKVLPRGKVHVMKMRYKDPNEYILLGREQDFVNDFWAAKPYTPAGVYASSSLYEAALESLETKVITLPPFMKVASKMLGGGLVKEEITVILAKTSIGKTSVVNEITRHIAMHHPEEMLGVLSLEATYKKYSRNLLSSYLKVPLHRVTKEEKEQILRDNEDKIRQFYERPDGSARFYVCDDRGASIESIKEKILEMVLSFGVTILIVDPYSDLLSGMDVSQQEELATWFKRIMKEYGVTPLIISHVRKSSNNGEGHITEDDAQGSSFLSKAAGITIALERDKQAEDPIERNSTYCYILKNREFSETGPASKFYYDIKTASLYDFDDYFGGQVMM